MKNCMPLRRETPVEVKMFELRTHPPLSEHFWKLRGSKSARGCAAKHILKSK